MISMFQYLCSNIQGKQFGYGNSMFTKGEEIDRIHGTTWLSLSIQGMPNKPLAGGLSEVPLPPNVELCDLTCYEQ